MHQKRNPKNKGESVSVETARAELFTRYLRLLDAETADVDKNKMAAVLFPEDAAGHGDRPGYKKADNGLREATKTRDGDYLYYLLID